MTHTHRVVHTGTGVVVGSFESEDSAREWIDTLGVVREYKEQFYRVERIQSFTYHRVGLSWFRRVNGNPDSSLFVTGPKDTSREVYGVHGNCDPRGFEYDSRCSSCFLGFSHSLDAHQEDLRGKVSRVRTRLEA